MKAMKQLEPTKSGVTIDLADLKGSKRPPQPGMGICIHLKGV